MLLLSKERFSIGLDGGDRDDVRKSKEELADDAAATIGEDDKACQLKDEQSEDAVLPLSFNNSSVARSPDH